MTSTAAITRPPVDSSASRVLRRISFSFRRGSPRGSDAHRFRQPHEGMTVRNVIAWPSESPVATGTLVPGWSPTSPGTKVTMAPIRVFLLDDHEVVRRGVRDLLESEGDIEVVGEASTA